MRRSLPRSVGTFVMGCATAMLVACSAAAPCPPARPRTTACGPAPCDPVPSPVAPAPEREGFRVATGIHDALDRDVLARIRERAAATRSAALIVIHDGELVVEESFGGDPERLRVAMSLTKSVVALGLGPLIERGLLDLDTPLAARVVPELARTDKASLTLRHLLSHTSGLPTKRAASSGAEWQTKTIEAHVLGAPLEAPIGSTFTYNGNAVDFLSVVVRRANPDRRRLDDWLAVSLFAPLGVHTPSWIKDAQGDPGASGELHIRAIDLAKLGQLVLDEGRWRGRQVIPSSWVRQVLARGQPFTDRSGLLWWRDGRPGAAFVNARWLPGWTRAGVDPATVRAAEAMVGQRFPSRGAALADLARRTSRAAAEAAERVLAATTTGMFEQETEVLAYRADGWLGQYVIVVPSARLVAVRMRDPRETSYEPGELDYSDFRWDVLDLVRIGVPVADR